MKREEDGGRERWIDTKKKDESRGSGSVRGQTTEGERVRMERQEIKQKRWQEKRENGKKDARKRMKIVEGGVCECKDCEKKTKDSIG